MITQSSSYKLYLHKDMVSMNELREFVRMLTHLPGDMTIYFHEGGLEVREQIVYKPDQDDVEGK